MSHHSPSDPDHPRPSKRARREAAAAADDEPAAAAAADPDAAAEEEDTPKPYRIGAVDWSLYKQNPNDPIQDKDFCLRCRYAACAAMAKADGNKKWADMDKYAADHRAEVHPFTFCREIQRLYNEGVRYCLTDNDGIPLPAGFDPGPWPAQQIYEHDTVHVVNIEILERENARTAQEILRAMANNTLFVDRAGHVTVDAKMAKEYFDSLKKVQPLYASVRKR